MLTIVKGRTFSFDATIYDTYVAEGDPGNVPTNHTGWTIRSQIRKKIGNVLVANLNVTFPVPTAGTVAIRHDRVFTRSLPVGDYWFDIVATDASGKDHVYVEPEPIAVHDHPTDPANAVYDFVPGGGGAISHTHSISDITGLQALLDDRLPPDGGTIARYLRGDNTWQLLNKSAVGLSLVENVTLSTWIGSSNITRLGTIISGSWQGSRIAPAYLGDGTSIETKFLRGDGTWQTVSSGAYIDLSDATTVDLPTVNTALSSALAGKAATVHTHVSADITDATSLATPSTLVRRDASGGASFGTVTADWIATAAFEANGISGGIFFDGSSYIYTTGSEAIHRTALGSGATGDALFRAASASAARTTLGVRTFVKPTGESRSSNSTYTVDTDLKDIPLEAGKSYKIEFYIPAYVPTTEGGKVRLLLPLSSRATVPIMNGAVFVQNWGNASGGSVSTSTSGAPAGMRYFLLQANAGYNQSRAIAGVAYTDVLASAGNLSLEWAQNTSGVNATILLAGSTITVTEL